MPRVLAAQLPQHVNEAVEVRGWLNNIRVFGKLNFLILRDRTGFTQVVIQDKAEYQKVAHLSPGSILTIQGRAAASSQTALGVEVVDPVISIDVAITEAPPIEYYKPEIPT